MHDVLHYTDIDKIVASIITSFLVYSVHGLTRKHPCKSTYPAGSLSYTLEKN